MLCLRLSQPTGAADSDPLEQSPGSKYPSHPWPSNQADAVSPATIPLPPAPIAAADGPVTVALTVQTRRLSNSLAQPRGKLFGFTSLAMLLLAPLAPPQ